MPGEGSCEYGEHLDDVPLDTVYVPPASENISLHIAARRRCGTFNLQGEESSLRNVPILGSDRRIGCILDAR